MLLVAAISILTGPNILTVLSQYISVLNLNGNIKQILGRRSHPWPHTTLYLNLRNILAKCILLIFSVSYMLSV